MFKLTVDYPSHEEGIRVLEYHMRENGFPDVDPVASRQEILAAQEYVRRSVHVNPQVLEYVVAIVEASRKSQGKVVLGGSPKASVHLLDGSRALAVLNGRDYVTPDDVKQLAFQVLNHRVIARPEYLSEVDAFDNPLQHQRLSLLISELVSTVKPPR